MSDETLGLIQRAQQGDTVAVSDLYSRYAERIMPVIRLRLGPKLRQKLDSCDVAQSVLLAAFRDFNKFEYRGEGAFLRWLSQIVENRIRDKGEFFSAAKRDVRKERPLVRDEGGESRLPAGSEPSPSQIFAMSEKVLRLEQAMDSLTSDYREVILHVKYEGLSLAETAHVMGRGKDAVRMLLARALARLSSTYRCRNDD